MERPFTAYTVDNPFIFVSYSHKDDLLVYPELKRLNDQNFNIWYDEGITHGANWTNELAKRIDECNRFILFITQNSVKSDHCAREIHSAFGRSKPFPAVHLEPDLLPAGLEFTIGDRQAIIKPQLSNDGYVQKLCKTIETFVDRYRLTELQLRLLWEEILKRFRHVEVVGAPIRTRSNFIRGYVELPIVVHPL